MVEGKDKKIIKEYAHQIKEVIEKYLSVSNNKNSKE
jgi:hypothetical protein